MVKYILLFIALSISPQSFAEKGDFGVDVDVHTTGLFPPRLSEVIVATVKAGSSANQQGVLPGDQVLAINDCVIPGCSALKARKIMKVKKGESAIFIIKKANADVVELTLTAE